MADGPQTSRSEESGANSRPGRVFDPNDPDVAAYDELPLWSAMAGQLLLRHLPLAPSLDVLDVGCGTGFPTIELAQRLGPESSVTGIDPWSAALRRARLKARTWGVAHASFVEGDAASMPFANASFDVVVSNLGVNNFANARAAFAECRRVARPGACLALTTNLKGHMAEFYAIFRSLLDAGLAQDLDRHVAHRGTVESLRALLEAAGFRVVRTERETAIMRFADGTALLRHSFIRLGFLPAWREVVPQALRARIFGELEAALNAHARAHAGLALSIPLAYVEARAG